MATYDGAATAASYATTSSRNLTMTTNVTVGKVLVVAFGGSRGGVSPVMDLSSITDSNGHTWDTVSFASTVRHVGLAWTKITTQMDSGVDTVTITWDQTPTENAFARGYIFGGVTDQEMDKDTNYSTPSDTDTSVVALTATGQGAGIGFAHWTNEYGVTVSENNSYTEIDNYSDSTGGDVAYYSLIWKDITSPGTDSPSETLIVTSTWAMAGVLLPESARRSQVIMVS